MIQSTVDELIALIGIQQVEIQKLKIANTAMAARIAELERPVKAPKTEKSKR